MRTDPENPLQESGRSSVLPPCAWLPPQNPQKAVTYPQGAQMFLANIFSSPHHTPLYPFLPFSSLSSAVYFALLAPMTESLLVWVMDVWFRPVFLCLLAKGERWGCLWWARVAGKQSVLVDRWWAGKTEVLKAWEFIRKLFKGSQSKVHESEIDVTCVWLHTSVFKPFLMWMNYCCVSWEILFITKQLGRDAALLNITVWVLFAACYALDVCWSPYKAA